jgi:hypothetical protein
VPGVCPVVVSVIEVDDNHLFPVIFYLACVAYLMCSNIFYVCECVCVRVWFVMCEPVARFLLAYIACGGGSWGACILLTYVSLYGQRTCVACICVSPP